MKQDMSKIFKEAFFSLAEARYNAGDISYALQAAVQSQGLKVKIDPDNVAGIMLPNFKRVTEEKRKKSNKIKRKEQ
jgi:V-type H+-transporting ATPase subunit D